MFTGIIEELGEVVALQPYGDPPADQQDDLARLRIRGPGVTADARPGDSIAVSGVCLTVVDLADQTFDTDVMRETLDRSSLGSLRPGSPVNVERPLTLASRLGGHLLQGHVDGTGEVLDRIPGGGTGTGGTGGDREQYGELVRFSLPEALERYVVPKGSIAVDGISLTVVDVGGGGFTVGLVPATLDRTTLGHSRPGDAVNLEVDIVAKYVERYVEKYVRQYLGRDAGNTEGRP